MGRFWRDRRFQFLRNRRRCIQILMPTPKRSRDRPGTASVETLTENPESIPPNSVSRYLHEMGTVPSAHPRKGALPFQKSVSYPGSADTVAGSIEICHDPVYCSGSIPRNRMSRIHLIRWRKRDSRSSVLCANGSSSQRFATGPRRFWPRWRFLKNSCTGKARIQLAANPEGWPAQLSSLPRTSWQAVGGVCACGKSPESRL